jgi:hypothetical protein
MKKVNAQAHEEGAQPSGLLITEFWDATYLPFGLGSRETRCSGDPLFAMVGLMTNELREQLIKVEAVVQATKPILARHEYTTANPRTPLTIGLIDQMIEHHEAMLVLVSK